MNRDFKGIWIPKGIWLSRELNLLEKMFLIEINNQDNGSGCTATNRDFAEMLDLSIPHVSRTINSLVKKGFVKAEQIKDGKQFVKRILKTVSF